MKFLFEILEHGGNNTGSHSPGAASVARQAGFVVMTNGDLGCTLISSPAFQELVTRVLIC